MVSPIKTLGETIFFDALLFGKSLEITGLSANSLGGLKSTNPPATPEEMRPH